MKGFKAIVHPPKNTLKVIHMIYVLWDEHLDRWNRERIAVTAEGQHSMLNTVTLCRL